MTTEWLLCDYGQVISLPPTAEEWAELATLTGGRSEDDYWRYRPAYDRGDLTAADYWKRVTGDPVEDKALAALIDLDTRMWLHINNDALDAALRTAQRGFELALLSNATVEVAAGIDGIEELQPFGSRFYSCNLRSVKPEPEAYAKVLDALGASAQDVVFFDDRPANVEAAAAMGMRAVRFERAAQFDAVR